MRLSGSKTLFLCSAADLLAPSGRRQRISQPRLSLSSTSKSARCMGMDFTTSQAAIPASSSAATSEPTTVSIHQAGAIRPMSARRVRKTALFPSVLTFDTAAYAQNYTTSEYCDPWSAAIPTIKRSGCEWIQTWEPPTPAISIHS